MHPARVFPYLTLLISTSAATTSATPAADCHNTCQSITSAFPKVPAKVCDTLCAPDGLACATAIQAWQGTAKAKTAISASENLLDYIELLTPELEAVLSNPGGIQQGVVFELQSRFRWTGHYDRCVRITDAHYCHSSFFQIGTVALCVPDSCSADTLNQLLADLIPTNSSTPVPVSTVCGDQTASWEAGTYVMVTLCILLVCLGLAATVVELVAEPLDESRDINVLTVWRHILDCFSLKRNFQNFCSLRNVATNSLDGMRTFSMSWVVFGHTLIWPLMGGLVYSNIEDVVPLTDGHTALIASWTGQVVQSAEFSVDTFFYMSGFLAVFVGLKKLSKLQPLKVLKTAPLMYIDRWLRLTPLYMFVVWLYVYVVPTLDKGPFYTTALQNGQASVDACKHYWYYNILYIQTIFTGLGRHGGSCYPVSWYLADDMMFFYLVPLIICLALIGTWLALAFLGTACSASIIYSLVKAFEGDWRVGSFDGSDYSQKYYQPPWTRCPPYLMGAAFGVIWYRWNREISGAVSKHLNLRVGLLTGAAFLLLITVYGLTPGADAVPSTTSQSSMNFYVAFSKPAWTLGLILLNVLCFAKQGWAIQWILELPLLGYIGKLSYGMYLMHPVVLALLLYSNTGAMHYSIMTYTRNYVAALALTTAMAFVAHIFVELPCSNLAQMLLDSLRPRPKCALPVRGVGAEGFAQDLEGNLISPAEPSTLEGEENQLSASYPNSPHFPGCESRRETCESIASGASQPDASMLPHPPNLDTSGYNKLGVDKA